ncbi:molybdopterin-synthase adenylyltransferase [Pseudoclavibacter chungangensis]|uniref:Molybdopterin-synthase adenylyltransferase n=1 Tax=Pseudoclavibacter chungangensis TaxID=587635 RepID=A0A7J5BQW4_9MICO|nr:HesA/MoeB/ThiF family protein [Pseudoclavibacter chungangensis]KAB1655647.1 molybdopterin-synthase adenylyltransferase [Pseudoclavibacter chungangensis]NYJ67951.1 adenylyltransferase/sulfurtransferase [Pseudoclavibacter chungangensis]
MPFPPLVPPGAELGDAEVRRTARQSAVLGIGELGQRRIAAARVLVVGAGGLGAPVVQYLAGAGIGRIDIVDDDVVEDHNLARQLLFTIDDFGRPKATALARAGARLDPAGAVVGIDRRVSPESVDELFAAASPHIVIDTTDDWCTRFTIADACAARGLPLVAGSVVGTDGWATVFWPTVDGGTGIDDFLDREQAAASTVSCAETGILGPLCGQLGSMLAAQTISLVTGLGEPLVGRVAIVDVRTARVREMPLRPRGSAADPAVTVTRTATARAGSDGVDPASRAGLAAGAVPTTPSRQGERGSTSGVPTADPAAPVAAAGPETAADRSTARGTGRGGSAGQGAKTARGPGREEPVDPAPGAAQPMPLAVRRVDETALPGAFVVDLREDPVPELAIPSQPIPLHTLTAAVEDGRIGELVPRTERVVIVCERGPRARFAARTLLTVGYRDVAVFDGGATALLPAAATAATAGGRTAPGGRAARVTDHESPAAVEPSPDGEGGHRG